MLAVVLASGGLDSCVCVAEAAAAGCDLALLHVDYGQRTRERELQAFTAIADHHGVPAPRRLVCDLDHLRRIGGSSLIDTSQEVETGLPAEGAPIPSTYVPFRNAHILCLGTSWAEVLGAGALYIGAVEEDSSGYPDCRASFFAAFQAAIDAGTRPDTHVEIRTPLIARSKVEIVRRGVELGAPLHATWSCYVASERACGTCESCRLRLRGFAGAGVADPIPYA
jgi:7-cyano-7-deazaguanine synthase